MKKQNIEKSLLGLFPKHEAGLFLQHNEHKNYHMTVREAIDQGDLDLFTWRDEGSILRAIETDEVWTLQWYPNSPVSFHAVAAPTIGELLFYAKEFDNANFQSTGIETADIQIDRIG